MEPDYKQIDTLIEILSHQLKSPINSIESLLNVIANGFAGDPDSRTRYFIDKAIGKTRGAREMISDIIKYESFGEERPGEKSRLDLIGLLKTLIKSYLASAMDKGLTLNSEILERKRIFLDGNYTGLQQAFSNLIENAIRYTDENGIINLSVVEDQKKRLVSVSIRDTGSGIEKGDLEKIFQPFFRAARTKTKISGTGLGLAIVKPLFPGVQKCLYPGGGIPLLETVIRGIGLYQDNDHRKGVVFMPVIGLPCPGFHGV